jgi:PAS domain S-box-containing protein
MRGADCGESRYNGVIRNSPFSRAVAGACHCVTQDVMDEMDRDNPQALDFRSVFEAAADGILVVSNDGRIIEANPEALRQFGYDEADLVGRPIEALVPENLASGHVKHRDDYGAAPHSRPMGIGMQLRGRRKDGSELPIEISLSPHGREDHSYVVCVVRDMTERVQLRNLGLEAIKGAERERRRIAQELHDDTAQLLSAVILRLKLLVDEEDSQRRSEAGSDLREQLREAAEGVRRIARGLRPPALEDAGVVTALRGHARAFFEGSDLKWEIHADAVDHLLGEDQKLVLYRIVQEAMANVVRHAEASSLEVLIRLHDSAIVASVRDDGRGFNVGTARVGPGLGLLGMRERAAGVGGHIEYQSTRGEGSTVVLTLPVNRPEPTNG